MSPKSFKILVVIQESGSPHLLACVPSGKAMHQWCSCWFETSPQGTFSGALEHRAVGGVPLACLLQQSCVQSCNTIFHAH